MASRILVSAFLVVLAGCANDFMAGSRTHKGVPPEAQGTWRIPTCTSLADASVITGPTDQTYYLARGETGPVLYELDAKGRGAAISNHWVDEQGDHFLTYVRTSHGWEYVIPKSGGPGARLVYLHGKFHVDAVDGVLKVTSGSPAYRCEMVPK